MSQLSPEVLVSIDGSYLIYYSLFGAFNKWADSSVNSHVLENVQQDDLPKLTQYKDFTDKFEDQLVKRFETIYWIINTRIFKDLKFTNDPKIFLCLDSPLKDNWRMKVYKEYKQQRKVAIQKFNVRDAFSYGMNVLLNKIDINKYFGIKVVKLMGAEGDDIIATINTKIPAEYKFIIASDKDFLQLSDNIRMFDLCGKQIVPEEFNGMKVSGKRYLLAKILTGDTSDNIPQVFNRCGYKTAMKLVLNQDELKMRLKNDPIAFERFKMNSKLIDFKNIPETLTESILQEINDGSLELL
jgi:5'-3' exonuclease